ncbi:MAG: TrkH family potassium uptake protein [Planctomycetota bacterium]|nr:MAG: TrkH family potassium uptake protein [Planctomycetota bacterium]REJ94115.1 MAG: TrkH family potassium uptake protein [Planctomycetota bacterium]REK26301.1 MAG: TrkH family potassium uptake protein [Planctomycetota bacterium]REK45852.1 MAG: TrkH family potassium uptake protein [Planctomycetota bacterium]
MNFSLLAKMLSRIAFLIGGTMVFSLPWTLPALGAAAEFERAGFIGLAGSIVVAAAVGGLLWYLGREANGSLYRKEAMAVVGLSWVLATVLGALPYLISGTKLGPERPMQVWDALFESQSGFSTTGATVITDLEDPDLVPRSILFWRSSTHFLGGLGIIVLFVAILGQGSAGKALMRSEMPGPSKEGSQARMQHTAWYFASIYLGLTAVLTLLLRVEGLDWFDSLCHSFGTMATGGFSTYNDSVGAFATLPYISETQAVLIEVTIIVFMVLAGTNFTLLYFVLVLQPGKLFADLEWRVFALVIVGGTLVILGFGRFHQDFGSWGEGVRHGLFQVVSVMTTTGYGTTADFNSWNSVGRGLLFLLMFVGGCAGSTGGGLKVIRHILFLKIMGLELERAYHPSVVRPLRISGQPVEDPELRRNILVYFGLVLVIFVFSWMALVAMEPDDTWRETMLADGEVAAEAAERSIEHKLIDSASGIAATLNNIGPGLGVVGAKQNYALFSPAAKLLFTFLMMLGRLEIFVILVLLLPGFWRAH